MSEENSILEKKEKLKPFESAIQGSEKKVLGLWDAMKRAVGAKEYSKEEKEAWWKKQKGKYKIGLIRTKELDTEVMIFNELFNFAKITKKKKEKEKEEEEEQKKEEQKEEENPVEKSQEAMKIQGQVRVKGFDTDKNTTEKPEEVEQPETFYTAKEFDKFYLGWLENSSYSEQEQTVIKSTMKQLFRFIFGTKKLKDVNDFHTHLIIAYTPFTPSEKIPCSNVLRDHFKASLTFYNDMVVRYIMEASDVYGVKGEKSPWKVPFDLQNRMELQKGLKDMIDLLDDEEAKCIEYGEDTTMTVQDKEVLERIASLTKTDFDYERLLRIFKKFVEDRQTGSPQSTYETLKKEFMIGKPEQTQKGKELFDSLVELLKVGPEEAEDMRVMIHILSVLIQKVKRLFEIQSKLDDILCRLKKGEVKPGDDEERQRLEAEKDKILEEIKKRAGFSRAIQTGDLKGFLDDLERRIPQGSGEGAEIESLRKQLHELTVKYKVDKELAEATRAKAEADKARLDAEIADLRQRVSAGGIRKEQAQDLRDEIERLMQQLQGSEAERRALGKFFQTKEAELQAAQTETLQTRLQLSTARTELERLRAQVGEEATGVAELQSIIQRQEEAITLLRKKLSEKAQAEAIAASALASQRAAEVARASAQERIVALEREIESLRAAPAVVENSARIRELEGQKRSLEEKLKIVIQMSGEKGRADEEAIAQLQAQVTASVASQQTKNTQIGQLTSQIGALSAQISTLSKLLRTKEGEKGDLELEIQEKEEQIERLQQEATAALQQVQADAAAQLARLQAEAATLRAESAAKGEVITAKQQQIEALIAEQAQRDSRITALNATIEAKDVEIAELEAGAAEDEEIKRQMRENIEQYKRIIEELRKQIAQLTVENQALRAKEAENASLIQMLDATLRDRTGRLALAEERIRELTGQVEARVEGRYRPGSATGGTPREYREGVLGKGSGLTIRSPVTGKIGYGAPGVGGWSGKGGGIRVFNSSEAGVANMPTPLGSWRVFNSIHKSSISNSNLAGSQIQLKHLGGIKKTPKLPKSSYCETMITLLLLHAYQNGLTDIQAFLDKAGASLDDLGQCPLVIHTLSKLMDFAEGAKEGEKEGVYFTPMNSDEQEQLKVIERVFNDRFDEDEQTILESFYPLTLYSKTPDQFQTVLGKNPYILNVKGQTKGDIPFYGIGDDDTTVLEESEQEALTEGGVPLGALLLLYLTCLRELEQTGESPSLNSKCHLPSPRRTRETAKTPKRKQRRKGKTLANKG